MPGAAVARVISIVLLLVIGGSGALVGLQLLGAMLSIGPTPPGSEASIALAVGGYGVAVLAGGVGLLLRKPWGWRLSVASVVAGLVALAGLLAISGRDAVLLGGIVTWAATLACLLVARTSHSA